MQHCLLSWGQHVMWPLILVLSIQISNYQFQSIFLWVYWKLLERHIVHDKHPAYVGADFRGMTWVLTIFSWRTLSHLRKVICRLLVFAFFFCHVLVCSGCYNKRPQTGWLVNNRNLFLTVLEAEIRMPVWLDEGPLLGLWLLTVSSCGRRDEGAMCSLF